MEKKENMGQSAPSAPSKREHKRVLWLSRHAPTEEQCLDLEATLGPVEIIQHTESVRDAEEVIFLMAEHRCDEVVAVLPLNILADLVKKGIKPIRAVMERRIVKRGLSDDGEETLEAEFKFKYFERVLKVEVETERLGGRECNCGSGMPWYLCSENSSYCG